MGRRAPSKKEARSAKRKARARITGPFHRDEVPGLGAEALLEVNDLLLQLSDAGVLGQHLALASAALGELARFTYWDHIDRDLKVMAEAKIPGLHAAWTEVDQGHQMILEPRGDAVFVFAGGDDWSVLDVGFRVPAALWRARWLQAIANARSG